MSVHLRHSLLIVLMLVVALAIDERPGAAGQSRDASTVQAAPTAVGPPPSTGQVTFLYYNDIERAAQFYGSTMGLRKTFDKGWVRVFALSAFSSVAVVEGARGTHKPSKDKPVNVAIVVEDVDAWYAYLTGRGVPIAEPPHNAPTVGVREFTSADPEGYSLECATRRGDFSQTFDRNGILVII